jgi:hypothetical protein
VRGRGGFLHLGDEAPGLGAGNRAAHFLPVLMAGCKQGLGAFFLCLPPTHPVRLVGLEGIQLVPQLAKIKHVGC